MKRRGGMNGETMGTYVGDVPLYGGVAGVRGLMDGLQDFLQSCLLRRPGGHGRRRRRR